MGKKGFLLTSCTQINIKCYNPMFVFDNKSNQYNRLCKVYASSPVHIFRDRLTRKCAKHIQTREKCSNLSTQIPHSSSEEQKQINLKRGKVVATITCKWIGVKFL